MKPFAARIVRTSPTLVLGAAFACSSETVGMTSPPPALGSIASLNTCVYESRSVQYCGGTMTGDWISDCTDMPCPRTLDNHEITFPDPTGGDCASAAEYRNVFDFAGSCDDWRAQGRPLRPLSPIYCGHSLLYNEFGTGGDMEDLSCSDCMQVHCAPNYAACEPSLGIGNRCDSLIRCLRGCAVGNAAAFTACMQTYADVVDAANAFSTCAMQSCGDSCD